MSALPKRYFTQDEYALLEERADYKSQFVAGEIYAMAGAEPSHVRIEVNLTVLMYNCFQGRPCEHFTSNMRVRVKAGEMWTYPDGLALCGEPKFDKSKRPASLLNPQVIFEVLSPSTEDFDRGDKFFRYQKLVSLTDYVLISPDRMQIDHYARQADGNWALRQYEQPTDSVSLTSVSAVLPLAKIYERVQFSADGEED